MGRIIGIIAEYNPFHNGHSYQIAEAKKSSGAEHVIVAMSGSFTQRGEPAAVDKFIRTRWALQNGADMVIELPVLFSCAHAERFASGGISLLCAAGIADSISFGAETADASLLRVAAESSVNMSGEAKAVLQRELDLGHSYPAAVSAALGGELGGIFTPNNTLGIEYIKAINKLSPETEIFPIKRKGAAHDADSPVDGYLSASAIRMGTPHSAAPYVPGNVFADIGSVFAQQGGFASLGGLYRELTYALLIRSKDDIAALPDVNEGLENLIYSGARSARDLSELVAAVKSKRYTEARIRRIFAHSLLGITKSIQQCHDQPRYIRVLGVKRSAFSLLSMLSKKAKLPVVITREDYNALDSQAKEMFGFDLLSRELQSLAHPVRQEIKNEFLQKLVTD